ncbi:hypothetical protein [Nonomuraea recticatena]
MVYSAGFSVQVKGRLQLGRGGVIGSDISRRITLNSSLAGQAARDVAAAGDKHVASLIPQTSWHRWISTKGWLYGSGNLFTATLPEGKSWARVKRAAGPDAAYGDLLVNIFEPATLKAFITEKNRKGRGHLATGPTGKKEWQLMYAGVLTFAEMFKLSPTFRAAANGELPDADRGRHLNWAVFVGKDGLPLRVVSFWEVREKVRFFTDVTVTDYIGWSNRAAVAPPPAGEVSSSAGPANLPEADDTIDMLAARPPLG